MNNYFIIHGSFGTPFGNWFSWLQDFLKSDDESIKKVYVPDFPSGIGYQTYENWSKLLKCYADLGLINENTTIIAHSIAPVFISKFLIENKIKVKKLVFVCGFNNYFGINENYDTVNGSMYLENIEDVKKYANEIICFYSDNDPYVKYEAEKEFADKVATKQIVVAGAGHINAEMGYDTFKEIIPYL
ncbi:MAG: alpha/beta hydrolase [Lachnospiraceae bacterium]|jgi:predicted alpha/beta hydrolase family esterase|nr:alpha/beta hydrolase [Lachnospiraceae bacterium]